MLKSQYTNDKIEAGLDEVGRGCLAGPVVAAAVVLPKNYINDTLDDSKRLNPAKRNKLYQQIIKDCIEWSIAEIDNVEIDSINILNASFLAMHHALDQLSTPVQLLLVDGNRFKPYKKIEHTCVIKGDGKYMSIAAASILAKVYRDHLMDKYDKLYPGYDWSNNVGYPTKRHREGISKLGVTPIHRMTFKLLPQQLELFTK